MVDIARIPDDYFVITEGEALYEQTAGFIVENRYKKSVKHDAKLRFMRNGREVSVYLKAQTSKPEFAVLRWNYRTEEPVKVLGDKWERAYADLEWSSLNGEKFMPWYFLCTNNEGQTTGCGVKVRPNSFVCFEYDSSGVTAWFDVRNGSHGVSLAGRELLIGTVVCEHYENMPSFEAARRFCSIMCGDPILPKEAVYGGNNWYYAYGKSSGEQIRKDAHFISTLAGDNPNRPFMVIDDGWQKNSCSGPWESNDSFGDMSKIADDFKKIGVKPGIWVRLLNDNEIAECHPDWLLSAKGEEPPHLDPSHPEVKNYLREVISRIRDWGFMLLKHDYSTFDIFGSYGFDLNGTISLFDDWSFYDKSKTSAEIVVDFYKLIREEAEDMIVLGCNTVSHLCAGLVEINRTGDDTSGKYWNRTRTLGVNTLAFRLPQNRSFYMVDADCVGILDNNIPWELNVQWLELLAKSGTPLFVSCPEDALDEEQIKITKRFFKSAAFQNNSAVPLDWEYNNIPHIWSIDNIVHKFDWVMNSYPILLKKRIQPM